MLPLAFGESGLPVHPALLDVLHAVTGGNDYGPVAGRPELRAAADGNATVRYVGHTLDTEDMRRHIEAGKQCMRLAMTWNDRVSFVLTPSFTTVNE